MMAHKKWKNCCGSLRRVPRDHQWSVFRQKEFIFLAVVSPLFLHCIRVLSGGYNTFSTRWRTDVYRQLKAVDSLLMDSFRIDYGDGFNPCGEHQL